MVDGDKLKLVDMCITFGQKVAFAKYTGERGYEFYAVKFKEDNVFYQLEGYGSNNKSLTYLKFSEGLLVSKRYTQAPVDPIVSVYHDIGALLKPQRVDRGVGMMTVYTLDQDEEVGLFGSSDKSSYVNVYSSALSENGKFLLANVNYKGFALINLETHQAKVLNNHGGAWYGGIHNAYAGAISNDGRYAYVGGLDYMYDTNNCGDAISDEFIFAAINRPYPVKDNCPYINFHNIRGLNLPAHFSAQHFKFSNSNKTFAFETSAVYNSPGTPLKKYEVISIDIPAQNRLGYLALGDSYSSGEGDIGKKRNGKSFYKTFDNYDGSDCHLSERSYPFLLRDGWKISTDKMQSIACSSAQVFPDYVGPESYTGQGNRLQSRKDHERKDIQTKALEEFTPGMVQQVEFIKKHQPKVVTLTGGGNDVGFSDVLKYCAYGSGNLDSKWDYFKEGVFGIFDCAYAMPNSIPQQILLQNIENHQQYTEILLNKIHEVSPESKVYVIGYPSFVADRISKVCLNAGELSPNERLAINYFTSMLNQRLRNATITTGKATYIDVYDSLYGGRLCEDQSRYVTGLVDTKFGKEHSMSNAFHPNAAAHARIAEAVMKKVDNGSSEESKAQKPKNIGVSYGGKVFRLQINLNDLRPRLKVKLTTIKDLFSPNSIVTIKLFSTPRDLGVVKTNDIGQVDTELTLPGELESGFHTLVFEGKNKNNENIIAYDFVTVGMSDVDVESVSSEQDHYKISEVNYHYPTLQSKRNFYEQNEKIANNKPIENSFEKQPMDNLSDPKDRKEVTRRECEGLSHGKTHVVVIMLLSMAIFGYVLLRRLK